MELVEIFWHNSKSILKLSARCKDQDNNSEWNEVDEYKAKTFQIS